MDATAPIPGIDVEPVTAWFVDHVPGAAPPLSFDLIAGGRSNLTFRVTDAAGGAWVLRRPPTGHVLATAHDMVREHRIISALAATDVPVAPAIGLCEDDRVNGAPFYVMGYVDGLVLRDAGAASQVSPEVRRRAGLSVAENLARIHAIDPDAVGLGDLGRKDGYIERQLKRWNGQFDKARTRDVPSVSEAHDRLLTAVPEQGAAAIVHGDYRLDNCMVDATGEVIAVLDWEICTLGDPLADLGVLMVYWTEPDDPYAALPGAATTLEGFPSRAEMVAAYEAAGGRAVGDLDYYVGFGYWKLACILEGVFTRYKAGAMGDDGADADAFGSMVDLLGQASLAALDKIGSYMALYDLHDQPALDSPVLVVVLEGWIDAGFAAGTAVATLLENLDTYPVATFDADQLLDHRARRPVLHLVEGVNTGLSWPGIEMRAATDEAGNDLLLLLGAEPDHLWRSFTESVVELAQDLGVRMVVGLGAYPATVPHTRPVTMSVTASSEELAAVSGLLRGSLDVPAGVQAAIEARCSELDLPAVGLWAQVPHYVSGEMAPYPAAALALIQQLERTGGLRLPRGHLEGEAERTRNRIDTAMANNADHLNLLHTLEQRHDEQLAAGAAEADGPLPSADELAAEVERFLRDQGTEG